MKWRIRALDKQGDRKGFDCGVPQLDEWLKKQARQSAERRLASVWIASPDGSPETIAGYYSLAPRQVAFDECPPSLRKGLPRYPLHAVLLARLAVSQTCQGQGLGQVLLLDALERALRSSQDVPAHVLVVDAKGEDAANFYRRYGLAPFPEKPLYLYLPMATIEQLLP